MTGQPDGRSPSSEQGADPVVLLVSASWAGPSRPAPTVLRELAGRWGAEVRALLLEDPGDEAIDQLEIELVPTWIRLEPVTSSSPDLPVRALQLQAAGIGGEEIDLSGTWREMHRRTGALPKHVIDDEFGPGSRHSHP